MASTLSESDASFMDRAFQVARLALRIDEVPVGCVLEVEGKEIATGCNEVNKTKNATRHAEFVAIDKAGSWCEEKGVTLLETLKDCSVFVTVEPCAMCAEALLRLKVKRIIYGATNDRFGGLSGVIDLRRVGIERDHYSPEVISGIRADEAIELLKQFYRIENPCAPDPKPKR